MPGIQFRLKRRIQNLFGKKESEMARKDALLRLHQRLIAKRDSLRSTMTEEIRLSKILTGQGGDVADEAHDGAQNELHNQLAALESRELRQIEKCIDLIREGRYGDCEGCESKIPIARLQALPFATVRVECAQKVEELGLDSDGLDVDWGSATEFEGRLNDREISLRDIDVEG